MERTPGESDDPEETVLTDMAALCVEGPRAEGPPESLVAGRYVVLDRLGSGGAAVVHEAYDTRLDRGVALKLLREDSSEPRERRRFVSEARLLGRLSHHPHLVQVLDAGVDGERPFLVLELVRGRTLGDELADGIAPDRLAAIGADVADALAHVHAAGIVHRDVKPGNVLVAAGGTVKLADFGIARLVDDTRRQTRTGCLVGTVAYLAPEQVAGEVATTAVDVYALGLVLLEALTGARAYTGTSVESALARLSRQPEVPVSLPHGWRPLLLAMTAREPAARPTAAQAAEMLRAIYASAPVPGPAPAAAGAAVPPRVVLAGLAAAFVLLIGVAATPSLSVLPHRGSAAAASRGPSTPAPAPPAAHVTPAPVPQLAVAAVSTAPPPAPHRAHPGGKHHGARNHHAPRHHHAGQHHHAKHHPHPKHHHHAHHHRR